MPAASPVRFTLTEIASVSVVVVPEAVERPNQAALSLKLQDKVPPVGLLRLSSCAAGFAPPATPLNPSVIGLRRMEGVEPEP